MTSGWSYQVAHPLFVVSGHPQSQRARAPPRQRGPWPIPAPNTPKGQRRHPLALGEPRPITRQVGRTGVKV